MGSRRGGGDEYPLSEPLEADAAGSCAVPRELYTTHAAWRCRPDGSNMDAYYKQHLSVPYSIRTVRQVPNSDRHVATAQGHHSPENGALILFNPSLGINNEQAMWLVSPGVGKKLEVPRCRSPRPPKGGSLLQSI